MTNTLSLWGSTMTPKQYYLLYDTAISLKLQVPQQANRQNCGDFLDSSRRFA
ncbi:hypothetical protein SUBVAR_06295 [Subdoligranulum variabile DSM 15176]|uniref:Uncharacterized protein n=1 Tax=Subdoligranulum variabile DSM 15176 TaxID=411471 RepID=D1PPI1_9FIRM|nr:hypothetical protein SUBVAR_06295 [Subdoligranulum variabile DSM 15176]